VPWVKIIAAGHIKFWLTKPEAMQINFKEEI